MSGAMWARALNNRDFQDKQLRFVQYGSRGLAFLILRSDKEHHIGRMLFQLYAQLSLSRKAFRAFRWSADLKLAIDHFLAFLGGSSDVVNGLSALQWLLMAMHIFWDNMFFFTHSAVGLIVRPDSPWWSNSSANQRQKNWRAMSDSVGLVASCVRQRRLSQHFLALAQKTSLGSIGETHADEGGRVAVSQDKNAAEKERRETMFAVMKLTADVATYFPQTTLAVWLRISHLHGWHDAYIGIAGCIAAVVSCRAEWIKLSK
mmetsp:Transcript_102283/g.298259  ORF Transcript_102283/g.298259 Transcript_102283/m.298259 type:complete len:260 (-) Transcript_102283:47-826(-)